MAKLTFKAFLSHRYKSPAVNQYFFDLLASQGQLHFEVDVGTKATNVTRLERLVRDSDAFIGIYPFPSGDDARPDLEEALRASRYFRLELDLALRSRRPALVFVDARYGSAVTVPRTIYECRYDHHEILAASHRHTQGYIDIARAFCVKVAASMRLGSAEGGSSSRVDRVGIVLPERRGPRRGYSRRQIAKIEERLQAMSLIPVHVSWQASVDGAFLREVENLDWAIVDIGEDTCASALPAFLHGYFVPQMRMLRCASAEKETRSPLEATLLGAFEVGYPKDIIRWYDSKSLEREFVQRLTTLYEPRVYIGTSERAREYFASAALRSETVFLSYSGEDRDRAANLSHALRKRFQQVFDYRDQGESIVPGRRWIDEVFDKLSVSGIGIPLLSPSYLRSGNCRHEAREMMALADREELGVIPVKISEGALELPSWMRDIQYVRGWQYKTADELADGIMRAYDAGRPGKPARKAIQRTARSPSR